MKQYYNYNQDKNHYHQASGPALSETLSSDITHTIYSSPTDTRIALYEFSDTKVTNNTQHAKTFIQKYLNSDFIIDFSKSYDAVRQQLRKIFSLQRQGKSSDYTIYNTPNGRMAFRLTHHEANGNQFEQDHADYNISVYVSYYSYGVKPSVVKYTEFEIKPEFYEANKKLCIDEIANAVKRAIDTGVFDMDSSIATRKDYPNDYVAPEEKQQPKKYNPNTKQMEVIPPKKKDSDQQENSNYNYINTMANKTKKALYESIMKDVAKTVKRHLNEAIHSELIDKQIYNSVNVFIHKYSPDELRILKPAKRFADVNALIQAYVCALKILGFDCPQSEDEFDVIGESHEYNSKYTGAFSEYAKQAIRMGGSIDDIIYLYNNTPEDNSTKPFGKPVKKKTEVDLYKVPAPDRLTLDKIWKNVDDVRNLFDSTIKLNKDLYYVIMGAIFEKNSYLSTSDRILNVCKLIKKFATIN